MQIKLTHLIPALLLVLLSACGEKAEESAPAAEAPVAAAPAAEAPVAAPAVVEPGGYTPTADELVPGITRTKEEQDKINAEALAGTPMPVIPGEEPAAAPAAEAPVAPAETK